MVLERAAEFERMRYSHSAWKLLASRRAPLVLACFESLFQDFSEIPQDHAIQHLGDLFLEFRNVEDFSINQTDVYAQARAEIKKWIKLSLIVERSDLIYSTDALQRAIQFTQGLDSELMTSTASRLLTVQNVIENLEVQLNPDRTSKVNFLKNKIHELEEEVKKVEAGEVSILEPELAVEGIKEVFQQAMSLKADFRRVEDSYRAADHQLRLKITKTSQSRSEILDTLLDNHDELLSTSEGKVFKSFYQQLQERTKLDLMKRQLRFILDLPVTKQALNKKQSEDLRFLISGLVDESLRVIDARARGEQDVKSYVKTGLASENFSIGVLINELTEKAIEMDWTTSKSRRAPANLLPVAIPVSNLPLIQRLLPKKLEQSSGEELDLTEQSVEALDLDDNFWSAYQSLDKEALFQQTLEQLNHSPEGMSLAELKDLCVGEHDLETITYWLSLARETNAEFTDEREAFVIETEDAPVRFDVPKVRLLADQLTAIDRDSLD